ncbi:hypothetical protein [Streptomyces sp. CB01580]|uniref:hypothetical protein n=1 Tax=Streptomyces sp. CB01580 TaxID=1703933 RepID=UPI0011612432|nr:hypothetical protein [Streptomyces sp. CB01580]
MSTFRFSTVAGAVCIAVICAGCSSQLAEQATAERPAAAASTAAGPSPLTPATPTVDPNVVPGSVLKTYLPTNHTLPTGWKLSSVFKEADSGPTQLPRSPAPSPTVLPDCDQLAGHGTGAAVGSPAAYAGVGVVDSSAHEVGVAVNSYPASEAAEVLSRLKVLEGICGTTYEPNSSGLLANPVTVTVSAVDGPGEGGVLVKVDRKIYVGQEFVVMQIGDRVLSVTSDNKYGGFADVVALAKAIAPRVK